MRNAIKVLIVDDDKASGQMMSEVVKRMGLKPILASKSSDALNIVRLQTVHAALVDILLPKMTGVDLVVEFRKTRFADSPVVFVSGVFKDKVFASDAMKKTGAVNFLFKPFGLDELTESLTKSLHNLLTAETWTVQSLLSRKLSSDRERAKAIEHLTQIQGLDFPFVLAILMEVGSSGHLNIVNESGEIFGVTLTKGTIAEVDSSESRVTGVLALIGKGYLSQEDWDEFQKSGSKKFSLERLVQEGLVSPHAVSDARREQIMQDFRAICGARTLQVNFVPQEDDDEAPKHAVKLPDLMNLLEQSLGEFFSENYLREFYVPVLNSPIRIMREDQNVDAICASKAFENLDTLKAALKNGGTLGEALSAKPDGVSKIYQCLHYLVLNRSIMFDDLNRAKNLNSLLDRYSKLYAEINGKSPDMIFEYFGVTKNSSQGAIQGIYDEYVRSNNPEQLGKEATPELRELCKKCFELVKTAKEVMLDEDKRAHLHTQIKIKAVETKNKASQLVNEGLETLRKGQAREALLKLEEAGKIHPSPRQMYIGFWAEIKAEGDGNKATRLQEMLKHLDAATQEDRKSPFYHMALGLIKKALGDATAASHFEKALQLDSEFVEARRELNSKAGPVSKDKKLDILNGDITEIVSHIFRRKVD